MNVTFSTVRGLFAEAYMDRDRALLTAAKSLEAEFIEAAYTSPRVTIRTPGFNETRQELQAVILDSLADVGSEDAFASLLEIVRDAASGKAESAAASARFWIAQRAKAYATFHASDAADRSEG